MVFLGILFRNWYGEYYGNFKFVFFFFFDMELGNVCFWWCIDLFIVISGFMMFLLLEIIFLRFGCDCLFWVEVVWIVVGMSIIFMIIMEFVENVVDFYLMGGVV